MPDEDELDAWVAEAAALLGVPPDVVDRAAVLDLARDAAHLVVRPAAPLTTFLAGYAAARAGGSAEDVERAIERLTAALRERDGTAP